MGQEVVLAANSEVSGILSGKVLAGESGSLRNDRRTIHRYRVSYEYAPLILTNEHGLLSIGITPLRFSGRFLSFDYLLWL